jgi:hypothetical protein
MGNTVATLLPLYYNPWFVGSQGALVLCFAGGMIFLRRRESQMNDVENMRLRSANVAIAGHLAEMDSASGSGDPARFFQSARAALQQKLALRWRIAPASITTAEIDARLNSEGALIRSVFALADEVAYSGQKLSTADLQHWKEIVTQQLKKAEEL